MNPATSKRPAAGSGFTLVELLVGMVVGLLVVLAITFVYLAILRSSADTLAQARLNQDVRAAMMVIAADLRRAGFWNQGAEENPNNTVNPFVDWYPPPRFVDIENDGSCARYAYDRNGDGEVTDDEHFGFRLGDGVLEVWAGNGEADCSGSTGWFPLVGDSVITVSRLEFHEENEDGEELPENFLRIVLEAERPSSPGIDLGAVRMVLTETVFLRNALIPDPQPASEDDDEDET